MRQKILWVVAMCKVEPDSERSCVLPLQTQSPTSAPNKVTEVWCQRLLVGGKVVGGRDA